MSAPSPARRAAFEVLRRVFEHDAWADRALPAALARHGVSAAQRGLAQRLAYGAVQRRGTADAVVANLADRPPERLEAPLLAALRLGLYELLFASATPDYAAVDQAVELAKGSVRGRRGSGLVNAVLRRAAREREPLLAALRDGDPAAAAVKHSHPRWLAERWWAELGAGRARMLMAADNEPPETALRVNALRGSVEAVRADLVAAGAAAGPAAGPPPLDVEEVLVVEGALGPGAARLIEGGRVVPQSRASAAVVTLLDPQPGERVLDLCAGPGVKTTQIAARVGASGEVVAVDVDPGRASRIEELAGRLGAGNVGVRIADAASDDLGDGYDRVLVDPPCSDLGTLASRPDARWHKQPETIDRLAALQRAILERALAALRPEGTLVYSTCTISAAENERQISAALDALVPAVVAEDLGARFPAVASPADRRFLQTFPDRHGTDGFFMARLRRTR